MKERIAKSNFNQLCGLCGQPILKGDACVSWGYRDDFDGFIQRHFAHSSCEVIYRERCDPETWHRFAFERSPEMQERAAASLSAARSSQTLA